MKPIFCLFFSWGGVRGNWPRHAMCQLAVSFGLFVCRIAKALFSMVEWISDAPTNPKLQLFCISIDDLWSQYHRIHVVAMKSSLINSKSTNTTATIHPKPKLIRFSPSSKKIWFSWFTWKSMGATYKCRRVIYIAALQNTQFMAAPKINSRPFLFGPRSPHERQILETRECDQLNERSSRVEKKLD